MDTVRRDSGLPAQLGLVGPWVLCSAVLIWHSLQYGFVTDDAYISFVYSRNFAEHGQLVFNPGMDPVEGYTNFLWVLILGLLMKVGLAPEVTSLVLGTGFAMGTLWLVMHLVRHLCGGGHIWPATCAVLLAFTAGYACWASGGLETQMFTFWVTWALSLYVRADRSPRLFRRLGPVLALAAMTRPEGLLITGLLGVHRLALMVVRDRRLLPHRDELWCVGLFAIVWAPWFAWRWWYYGYPLPNTAYVKAAGEAVRGYEAAMRKSGMYYVAQFARQTGFLFALPLVIVGLVLPRSSEGVPKLPCWPFAQPADPRFVFGTAAALIAAVYLIYTARVGGDFMGLFRFVMPVLVIAAVGAVLGARDLVRWVPAGTGRCAVIVMVAAVLASAHGYRQLGATRAATRWGNFQSDRGIDTPAFLRVYAHDRAVIGKHMRPCFREDDFVIYGGAGAKPYYAEARGIDVFGLVSERVAHEVPRTRPRAGHNKWAPDSLLAELEPTFVFSCYSIHRQPDEPSWNCRPASWRRRGYEPVTLHIPGLLERGEYYSFMVHKDRLTSFECPGRVK